LFKVEKKLILRIWSSGSGGGDLRRDEGGGLLSQTLEPSDLMEEKGGRKKEASTGAPTGQINLQPPLLV